MQWMFSFPRAYKCGQNAFEVLKRLASQTALLLIVLLAQAFRIIIHPNLHWALAMQHLKFVGGHCIAIAFIQGNRPSIEQMVVLVLKCCSL
jgi:hypothetical protein